MKAYQTAGLMVVMFTAVRLAGAQVLTQNVGFPDNPSQNPGGATIALATGGVEGQVTTYGILGFSTAFAGDLVLFDPAGGNAPSNWGADVRFFNPLDPTGSLGLPATETEAFFPAGLGPGGFAAFKLLPHYNLVPASTTAFGDVIGTESAFGPFGGILSGQLAVVVFAAHPIPTAAAVPEPGSLTVLLVAGVAGAGFLRLHRRRGNASASA